MDNVVTAASTASCTQAHRLVCDSYSYTRLWLPSKRTGLLFPLAATVWMWHLQGIAYTTVRDRQYEDPLA